MYLIAIGWIYVVLMMALAEALSSQGSVLGALVTFAMYGLLPLVIVLYIMGAPGRRKARRKLEGLQPPQSSADISSKPDGGSHPSGDSVAAERKES